MHSLFFALYPDFCFDSPARNSFACLPLGFDVCFLFYSFIIALKSFSATLSGAINQKDLCKDIVTFLKKALVKKLINDKVKKKKNSRRNLMNNLFTQNQTRRSSLFTKVEFGGCK